MTGLSSSPHSWDETLRDLAAGASIAATMLIPFGLRATASTQRHLVYDKEILPVTTIPDGMLDLQVAFWRTPYGVERLVGAADTMVPVMSAPPVTARVHETRYLPLELRVVSGLPVDILARLVGVSRMRYHEWLRGAGISDTKAARLVDLLATFRTLQTLRGPDLRTFLETHGPAGQPLTLLERGDSAAVIGLALRAPMLANTAPVVSDAAHRTSDVPGWVRPARRLAWEPPSQSDETRADARARVSPRAVPEAPDETAPGGADDAMAAVAGVLFVE
jgi:hypothetical protein